MVYLKPDKTEGGYLGSVVCFASVAFYAGANIVLRMLVGHKVDPDWSLLFKEGIGFFCLLPWILYQACRGRYRNIALRYWVYVILAALICELVGAKLHLWCYATIGLGLSMPIIRASTVAATLLLGHSVLREPFYRTKCIAAAFLVVGIALLGFGKQISDASFEESMLSPRIYGGLVVAGVLAAVVAGTAYAIDVVFLRMAASSSRFESVNDPGDAASSTMPTELIVCLFLAIGAVVFSTSLYLKSGWNSFIVSRNCLVLGILTGLLSGAGFFLQVIALRMTTVSRVAFIAVSQVLLLSLLGFWFFREPSNTIIYFGMVSVLIGVVLSTKQEKITT